MQALNIVGIPADRLLHSQRGVTRAHGMIFVSERRAEQRKNAVAHDLIDRTFIAMDGFDHALKHGMEQPARILGVTIGN